MKTILFATEVHSDYALNKRPPFSDPKPSTGFVGEFQIGTFTMEELIETFMEATAKETTSTSTAMNAYTLSNAVGLGMRNTLKIHPTAYVPTSQHIAKVTLRCEQTWNKEKIRYERIYDFKFELEE